MQQLALPKIRPPRMGGSPTSRRVPRARLPLLPRLQLSGPVMRTWAWPRPPPRTWAWPRPPPLLTQNQRRRPQIHRPLQLSRLSRGRPLGLRSASSPLPFTARSSGLGKTSATQNQRRRPQTRLPLSGPGQPPLQQLALPKIRPPRPLTQNSRRVPRARLPLLPRLCRPLQLSGPVMRTWAWPRPPPLLTQNQRRRPQTRLPLSGPGRCCCSKRILRTCHTAPHLLTRHPC